MRLVLLILSILAFGSVAAFGQPSTVIGSIDRITGSNITVKTPRGSFTIHADDRTETVKDKTHRGLPSLTVGQEISVRCEANGPGKLRAVRIWAKVIAFSATVKHVGDDDIEVVTIPNADYPREENRIVHLHADTVFGTSRDYLSEGQNVRIVGLEVGNEAVDAARIALYNTDLPADTGPRLPHRYSVCPPQRHSLAHAPAGTRVRVGNDVLAPPARLATSGRVGSHSLRAAGLARSKRSDRLVASGGGQLFHPRSARRGPDWAESY